MASVMSDRSSANEGIIPEVKLVPKAQPRDTNNQVVLFPLSMIGR